MNGIVVESAVGLFEAYNVKAEYLGQRSEPLVAHRINVAVIGFTSEPMCGAVLLRVDTTVLARSYPMQSEASQEELTDWSGELVNQLLGRVKKRLLAYGLTIQLSTPTAVVGSELQIGRSSSEMITVSHEFGSEWGQLYVRCVVSANPELELSPVQDRAHEAAAEGDLLLF